MLYISRKETTNLFHSACRCLLDQTEGQNLPRPIATNTFKVDTNSQGSIVYIRVAWLLQLSAATLCRTDTAQLGRHRAAGKGGVVQLHGRALSRSKWLLRAVEISRWWCGCGLSIVEASVAPSFKSVVSQDGD